jgi:uncharacterized protein DUF4411
MKRYCFDTSGIFNPLETMPEDIHGWLWKRMIDFIESGSIAVTTEIYEEMTHIGGGVGECIKRSTKTMILEVNSDSWDWKSYVRHIACMQKKYHPYISEYNGGSKRTICLNDLSIIALAKTLGVPVVSMEAYIMQPEAKWRRIPNVCQLESVEPLTFNQFLRRDRSQP